MAELGTADRETLTVSYPAFLWENHEESVFKYVSKVLALKA